MVSSLYSHLALGRLPDQFLEGRLDHSAWSSTISHWVEAGRGIPRSLAAPSSRLKGIPLPYFSRAIMLPAVASYFFAPTPSGARP